MLMLQSMAVERTFAVAAAGTGRPDYSEGTDRSAEPVIRGWESLYAERVTMTVTAEDSETEDLEVDDGYVTILHDFVASRPNMGLIRFVVQSVDSDGVATTVFDKSGYQKVEEHAIKGYVFTNTIRLIVYNYDEVDETLMRIAIAGFNINEDEYYIGSNL